MSRTYIYYIYAPWFPVVLLPREIEASPLTSKTTSRGPAGDM